MVSVPFARPEDVARALARSPVFGVLDPPSLLRLATGGTVVTLEPGQDLARQGDPGDAAYLILQGGIEVRTLSTGGAETVIAALGPGEIVGEMAVLDGGPRSADLTALRACRVLKVSRQAFLEVLADHPEAALALIAGLSLRLRQVDGHLEARQVLDLGGRLARALLDAATGEGLVAVTQTELARRVGASREKVNRKLHAWVGEGLLRLDRSGVRILSTQRLRAVAGT